VSSTAVRRARSDSVMRGCGLRHSVMRWTVRRSRYPVHIALLAVVDARLPEFTARTLLGGRNTAPWRTDKTA
jgi:hypothetical protein